MTQSDTDGTPADTSASSGRVWESLREIAIVALGILVAFWIDAWWDDRQELAETERLLSAVVAELVMNAEVLERTGSYHGLRAEAGLGLLRVTGPTADAVAAEEAVGLVTSFWSSPRAELSVAALAAALESGRIGLISDEALRNVLAGLPGEYSGLDELEGQITDIMNQHIFPRLWAHVPQMNVEIASGFGGSGALYEEFRSAVPPQSRFSADLRGLLRDLTFENAVVERTTLLMIARNWSATMTEQLREAAVALEAR